MKIPSIKEARDKWGITKLEIARHDQNIDNTYMLLKPKLNLILKDIKENEYIVGLKQYNLADDEIYAIHMMLICNENIILTEENGTVKYVYIDAVAKEGLGIKAFGFYWLDMDVARYIRKKYKLGNEKVFQDICFILNTLMGYAFRNNSSVSNKNIINIYMLANNLFMKMDQFLIALTVLSRNDIVLFNRHDVTGNFKFKFCQYLSSEIESRLSCILNKQNNIEENEAKESDEVDEIDEDILLQLKTVMESKEKISSFSIDSKKLENAYNKLIDYFKSKQNEYDKYYKLPQNDYTSIFKLVLRNKLINHPNIIFRPHNIEANKNIQYEYQYVDAELKKENFSDYCIFRFVPSKIIKIIDLYIKRNNINLSIANVINVLDFIHRKFYQFILDNKLNKITLKNIQEKIEFISNWFTTSGFLSKEEYLNSLMFLHNIGILNISHIINTPKQLTFNIQLTHRYDNLNSSAEDIVSVIESHIQSQNTLTEKNIINEDTKIYSDNIDKLDTNELRLFLSQALDKNNKLENLIKELNNKFDLLYQENENLTKDNIALLLRLSNIRKINSLFKNNDMDVIKEKIQLQISLLTNKVYKELSQLIDLDNTEDKQALLKLNCQKQILQYLNVTENNILQFFAD